MIITEILERNAKFYPNDTALVEINPVMQPGKTVTWREYNLIVPAHSGRYRREMNWREFNCRANRFANLLLSRGVKKGDKVAILLMNCIEWLPIYFGILKMGAIAVPMNFRYSSDEIKYCLELSDTTVLVTGPEFVSRIENVIAKDHDLRSIFFVGSGTPKFADNYEQYIEYCSATPPAVALIEDEDAAIYFSSGTTGFPKAILHTHAALVSACVTEQHHHQQTRDDIFLCIPPLYHTGAKMHWFGSLLSASKAVLLRGVKPEWVLETISSERITIVWLLVPWAQDILDYIEHENINLDKYQLEQWRLMHIGAQPVPPSLIERWLKVFPNQQYDTNYGLSESIGPGCVHLGLDHISKVGAIGKAGYRWETKIIYDTNSNGENENVGELAVKGPGVMKGYYKNPEATAEVLKDGWLLTGDVAKEDQDGFIYLVDRRKDVIISGGENLYPVQIEDFLRSNSKIKDVAVIGLPDKRLGEIATAIIEPREEECLSEEEIQEFCLDLPRYKRPRKIIFSEVPRNPTGKIEKPKLRKKFGGQRLVEMESSD